MVYFKCAGRGLVLHGVTCNTERNAAGRDGEEAFKFSESASFKIPTGKEKKKGGGSSRRCAAETNQTRNQEVADVIPGLALWVKDLVLP